MEPGAGTACASVSCTRHRHTDMVQVSQGTVSGKSLSLGLTWTGELEGAFLFFKSWCHSIINTISGPKSRMARPPCPAHALPVRQPGEQTRSRGYEEKAGSERKQTPRSSTRCPQTPPSGWHQGCLTLLASLLASKAGKLSHPMAPKDPAPKGPPPGGTAALCGCDNTGRRLHSHICRGLPTRPHA